MLLRMGFGLPRLSPAARWALTPPFHPCLAACAAGRYVFCATVRRFGGADGTPSHFCPVWRLAVSQHPARWSPDFPPGCPGDRLVCSRGGNVSLMAAASAVGQIRKSPPGKAGFSLVAPGGGGLRPAWPLTSARSLHQYGQPPNNTGPYISEKPTKGGLFTFAYWQGGVNGKTCRSPRSPSPRSNINRCQNRYQPATTRQIMLRPSGTTRPPKCDTDGRTAPPTTHPPALDTAASQAETGAAQESPETVPGCHPMPEGRCRMQQHRHAGRTVTPDEA